jgi:internalin A
VHHQSLEKTTENKIMAYPLDEHKQLCFDKARELSCVLYKNFTNNKRIESMKKIFISYSRKDLDFKNELKKHLNMLHQFDVADNWSCEEITIGKWDSQIQKELQEADLIIYMLSANFFSSKYILEQEVQVAMERLDAEQKTKMLCVVVSEFVGLDKLKEALEHRSKTALQDAILALAAHQYLPYGEVLNRATNNREERIVSLKEHSNKNTLEQALTQITEKILALMK